MVQGFRKWPGGLYGSQIFQLANEKEDAHNHEIHDEAASSFD